MSKENRGKDEVRDQELRTSTFNLRGDMPLWNEWSPWLLAMRPDPQPKPRERNSLQIVEVHPQSWWQNYLESRLTTSGLYSHALPVRQ